MSRHSVPAGGPKQRDQIVGDDRAEAVGDDDDALVRLAVMEVVQQLQATFANGLTHRDIARIGADVARHVAEIRRNHALHDVAEPERGEREARVPPAARPRQHGQQGYDQHGRRGQPERDPYPQQALRHLAWPAQQQDLYPVPDFLDQGAFGEIGPVEFEEIRPRPPVGGAGMGFGPARRDATQFQRAGHGIRHEPDIFGVLVGGRCRPMRRLVGDPGGLHEAAQRLHRDLLTHSVGDHDRDLFSRAGHWRCLLVSVELKVGSRVNRSTAPGLKSPGLTRNPRL